MNKFRLGIILLLLLTAAMLVGLLTIRTVAPRRTAPPPTEPPGPAAGTPTAVAYRANNAAFEVLYPTGWAPLAEQSQGWWWFAPAAEPDRAGAPTQVLIPTPPPTPTLPPDEPQEPADLAPALPASGPAVGLSYAPLGDPQRDPEDAVYRWFQELEPWLPWALPEDEPNADEEAVNTLWRELRTFALGEGQYPAAEADFVWDTPTGPLYARLVLVKVYGQVWAFFAYGQGDAWPAAQDALQVMLQTFRPAPDPAPAQAPREPSS